MFGTTAAIIGGAALMAGASVVTGAMGSKAAGKAAKSQAEADVYAADLQYKMFEEQKKLMEPWMKAGSEFALPRLMDLISGGPLQYTTKEFMAEPYVGLALKEGQQAIESGASARGMLSSGRTMKDISRSTADYITGAYPQREQQKFNQWLTGELAPLQSLAGIGQTASAQTAEAGGQAAGKAGQAYMAAGEARASGYINQANAWSGAINTGMSNITDLYMFNKMLPMLGSGSNFSNVSQWG